MNDDDNVFGDEKDGFLLHIHRHPYASVFCTRYSSFDHTYICAVKVLCFSYFIGIDAGVYAWQIACYDLGFWICFADNGIDVIAWLHFDDVRSCRGSGLMDKFRHRVIEC